MKINRHKKILEIIKKYNVETQEELAERLKQSGYDVTQATVSRDIRELKLNKMAKDGKTACYVAADDKSELMSEKYMRVLKEGFITMDVAGNLLVIKTVPGMAMAVAATLDSLKWHQIVGCIAGDDTVMCAIKTNSDALTVMNKLNKIINYKL